MGSFMGHALPGLMFLLISSWWFLNLLFVFTRTLRNRPVSSCVNRSRFKSTSWFLVPCRRFRKVPLEPIVKILLSIIGIALELFPENAFQLISKENGEFKGNSMNNYAHSAMYGFFLFSGLLECLIFWNVLALPKASQQLAMSFAFFIEGLLFFFHLAGRPVLDVRLHTFLYLVVFATSLVFILEAWMRESYLLVLVRVYLVMLQGTWFFQIAHCLHGANPWKDTPPNREFVTIAFSWHCLVLLFAWLVVFVVLSVRVRGCHMTSNTTLENIEIQMIGSHQGDSERSSLIDGEDAEFIVTE